MKSEKQIKKELIVLEKAYKYLYELQGKLDMFDEKESADFDKISDRLIVIKPKINLLEWILES